MHLWSRLARVCVCLDHVHLFILEESRIYSKCKQDTIRSGVCCVLCMFFGLVRIKSDLFGADEERLERAHVVVGTRNIKPPRNCYLF